MMFKVNVQIVVLLGVVALCTAFSVHLVDNRFKNFHQDKENLEKLSRHYRDDGLQTRRCGYEVK